MIQYVRPKQGGKYPCIGRNNMEKTTTIIPPGDVERQLWYCAQVAAVTAQWPERPLAFVDTYGCQQNEADSERIRGYLE